MLCTKCRLKMSAEEANKKIKCDYCNSLICQSCSDLVATEVRCMQLTGKRVLKFYCMDCEDKINQLLTLDSPQPSQHEEQLKEVQQQVALSINEMKEEINSNISQIKSQVEIIKETNIELIYMLTSNCTNITNGMFNTNKSSINKGSSNSTKTSSNIEPSGESNIRPKQKNASTEVPQWTTVLQTQHKPTNWKQAKQHQKGQDKNNSHSSEQKILNTQSSAVSLQQDNRPKSNIICTGTSDTNNILKAAESRAWVYVGKVNPATTPDSLKAYLNKKFLNNNFTVEEIIKHELNHSRNKSFKVSFDFELLEEMSKGDSWPKGYIVKRYQFFREGRYVNKLHK